MLTSDLDLTPQTALALAAVIDRPKGLVLICGPTGAGKTTTAEMLSLQIARSRPMVQLDLESSSASELDEKAHALAGDVRSARAALAVCDLSKRTLILATLRSGRSAAALQRLGDMGVPEETLVRTSPAIVTQQLCLRLCRRCRLPELVSKDVLSATGLSAADLSMTGGVAYKPHGCAACSNGYDGHVPLFEVLVADATWSPEQPDRLRTLASMRQDAVIKIAAGFTSMAEIARVMGKGL